MSQELYPDNPGIPTPSQKDHQPYIHLINMAVDWAHKHRNAPDRITDPEADFIMYMSFLISETEWWIPRFTDSQKKAGFFYRDPDTYWRTIATGGSNPKIIETCKKLLPSLNPETYLPKITHQPPAHKVTPQLTTKPKRKPTHKRGELWKLDRRWDHLWPSSHKTFLEILRRTQYPKRPENFPWCQAGVKSLKKFTGVSVIQVRRALIQLERSKLIKRIVRGYKDQGASRYRVFLVPAMSGAFSWKSLHAKKNPRPKKRIRRIS